MAVDAVLTAIGGTDRNVDHLLEQRIECTISHHHLDSFPGLAQQLRLDRQRPSTNTEYFGKNQCGLPCSPVHSLRAFAGDSRGVLILDQLDAIRWTSVHSPDAMDVVEELVEEALAVPNLRVVVACRTLDMNDHPRIRAWKKDKEAHEIQVGLLTDQQVQTVVEGLESSTKWKYSAQPPFFFQFSLK